MTQKQISLLSIIFVFLLLVGNSAYAVDLPIEIDIISRQGEERQDAITVRHQIDLFSETAQDLSIELAERQERERLQARQSLFTVPHELNILVPEESLLLAVVYSNLFMTPHQSRNLIAIEDESNIPIWVIIPVLVVAAGSGLSIAILTKAKRKEKSENVHNYNN